MKRRRTMKVQMSFAVSMIVLFTVGGILFLSNLLIQAEFENYIAGKQEKKTEEIIKNLSHSYENNGQEWQADHVHTIGMYALYEGFIIQVLDQEGTMVWDARNHDMSLCASIMDEISVRMEKYVKSDGEFTVFQYEIPDEQEGKAGSVTIEYYGPYFLAESDFEFLKTLNKILIIIGGVVLIFSVAASWMIAGRFSKPVLQAVKAAKSIAMGKYKTKMEQSGTAELDGLAQAVHFLGDKLSRQEQLRKQLTQDVAHELRTPLTSAAASLEAMADGIWKPTEERILSCREEILRISSIAEDIEMMGKVEQDVLRIHKERTDLLAIAEKMKGIMEKEITGKALQVEIQEGTAFVNADEKRMEQVIRNLFSNAVKYTSQDGRIKVTRMQEAGQSGLQIEDNGTGISEEDLPHVFERFYRADKSRNRSTGGTGVGLAIVKTIIEAHGGSVQVHSKLNEGSCFSFLVPK